MCGENLHPIDVPGELLYLSSTYPSTIKNEGKVEGYIGVIARKTFFLSLGHSPSFYLLSLPI